MLARKTHIVQDFSHYQAAILHHVSCPQARAAGLRNSSSARQDQWMDEQIRADLEGLLRYQDGVISRAQAVEYGAAEHEIRRLLRTNEWARVHPGVYVDHTGPLTWQQRAWAAVLCCQPAALCHESARRAADGPGRAVHDDGSPIHVAVDHSRMPAAPDGVRVHRLADFDAKVLWNASPPRQRPEEAVVDLAASARTDFRRATARSTNHRKGRSTAMSSTPSSACSSSSTDACSTRRSTHATAISSVTSTPSPPAASVPGLVGVRSSTGRAARATRSVSRSIVAAGPSAQCGAANARQTHIVQDFSHQRAETLHYVAGVRR